MDMGGGMGESSSSTGKVWAGDDMDDERLEAAPDSTFSRLRSVVGEAMRPEMLLALRCEVQRAMLGKRWPMREVRAVSVDSPLRTRFFLGKAASPEKSLSLRKPRS